MTQELEQASRTARTLVLVGGLLTIVLTLVLFFLQTPLESIELKDLTGVVTNVILGSVLIVAAWYMTRSPLTAILLAFVASIALLGLGGSEGLIGGLFGIFGAAAGAAPILWALLTQDG